MWIILINQDIQLHQNIQENLKLNQKEEETKKITILKNKNLLMKKYIII